MTTRSTVRLYGCTALAGLFLLAAAPARAQYQPRPLSDPATGESYHIEAAAGFWNPNADITVASESLGIPGTEIDAKRDLGLTDQRFPELHVVLRPFKKHKLRFQYIPIKYEQETTLTSEIVFKGQKYTVGLPVNSSLDWKAYRFGYEYDAFYTNRGYVGLLLDVKYTDVNVALASPLTAEFTHAKAPIPAIGGVGRIYVMPNISITGEVSGFTLKWLPDSIKKDDTGHYVDVDVYGTLNLLNNVGVQVGYRSLDVGYFVRPDSGSFKLKGLWFGAVLRY
jgi:hypothetical protein